MPKVTEDYLLARRRQILDAAARCFARDGFHRTSMQDIVRESDISAGLVYRYFTGKDDMIIAIVGEWHTQRQAAFTGAWPAQPHATHTTEEHATILGEQHTKPQAASSGEQNAQRETAIVDEQHAQPHAAIGGEEREHRETRISGERHTHQEPAIVDEQHSQPHSAIIGEWDGRSQAARTAEKRDSILGGQNAQPQAIPGEQHAQREPAIVDEQHGQPHSAIIGEWDGRSQAARTADPAAAYLGLLRSLGDPAARDDARLGVQVWAEALRSPEILALVRAGVDGPRVAATAALGGNEALARVLIAIYQGLLLQTAWDEPVDHAAFANAVEQILARLTT